MVGFGGYGWCRRMELCLGWMYGEARVVFGQKLWCFVKDGGCREWVKFSGEIG